MSFNHIRDVFYLARRYHIGIRTTLEDLETQVHDPFLHDVVDRLKRHETYLARAIGAIEAREPEAVLGLEFNQDSPGRDLDGVLGRQRPPRNDPDDLVRFCLELDRSLIGFYEGMVERPLPPVILHLFREMLRLESLERDRVQAWMGPVKA